MDEKKQRWENRRKRVHEVIEVGYAGDWLSQGYDWFGTVMLILNLVVTILDTFDAMVPYDLVLTVLEEICDLSARVVVNQVSMKMENERITKLVRQMRELIR